ncbi:MAG: hypothetical protein HC771_11220 [Synechococcales cyanobacterium CRU_2_2]|nr:hypothetical protein [Synechococcales cyanobacterium CRU_2_2]
MSPSFATSLNVLVPPQPQPANGPSKPQAWKRLSVGQFFEGVHWGQTADAIQDAGLVAARTAVSVDALSYRLSVGQFFGAIPWQGAQADGQAQAISTNAPDGLREVIPTELPDLDAFADSAAHANAELTLDDIFGSFADF